MPSSSISIHALLAESDCQDTETGTGPSRFLSTLSLRRATGGWLLPKWRHRDFYPRSPCGERPFLSGSIKFCNVFLSTLSLRRATLPICRYGDPLIFLSTLSLRRATFDTLSGTFKSLFLSTLSLRRATSRQRAGSTACTRFLSTLSLRRATAKVHKTVGHFCAYGTNFMGISSSC